MKYIVFFRVLGLVNSSFSCQQHGDLKTTALIEAGMLFSKLGKRSHCLINSITKQLVHPPSALLFGLFTFFDCHICRAVYALTCPCLLLKGKTVVAGWQSNMLEFLLRDSEASQMEIRLLFSMTHYIRYSQGWWTQKSHGCCVGLQPGLNYVVWPQKWLKPEFPWKRAHEKQKEAYVCILWQCVQ